MYRALRRWSQTDLALMLGYESKFIVWQYENGRATPTADERRKLAKVLGISERLLFPNKAA
jgi:ribosome-binding protein aMBF1 (putative translation factor)